MGTSSPASHESFDREFIQPGVLEGEQIQLTPCSVEPVCVHWSGEDTEFWLYRIGSWICTREKVATRDFYFSVVLEAELEIHCNGWRLENGDGVRYGIEETALSLLPPGTLLLVVAAGSRVAERRGWDLDPDEVYTLPGDEQEELLKLARARLAGAAERERISERMITDVLDEGSLRKATRDRIHPKRFRLITAALELLDQQDLTRSVQAQDLAKQLGVTGKTLENAFHTCLNTTPYRFIILKRLHLVRRELLLHEARRGLVTEVAMEAGFDNLSRMSGMYRDLFGESPKETLGGRG